MFGRGRRQQPGLGVMLLMMQLFQHGFNRIPPVTLTTIAANVAIYLKLFAAYTNKIPSIHKACVSTFHVWHRKEWTRLVWGSLFHADDWHLYYNMVSFLWKGLTLERTYGSVHFAFMLAVFSCLTNVTMVGLNMLLEHATEDSTYITSCAAGFSGVIFALKVVSTHLLPPGIQYVMGMFPVPSRLAVWIELLVIQILVPNASFTGHLAGILVGIMYIKGPLKGIMESFISSDGQYIRNGNLYYTQSGRAAGGRNSRSNNTTYTQHSTASNTSNESRFNREATTNDERQQPRPANPELDDIRQRRLARFTQNT